MRKTLLRIIRELNLLSYWWKIYRFLWNFFLAIFMGNPSLRLSEVLYTWQVVYQWMNCWWWALMTLATLPTIRLTDDCEICNESPAMLWKLPVVKNRKLANSYSIGGMLDALPKNVLKSSLIMSKIFLTVSFENLNLPWNSWSSRCSNGFDLSLK